MNAIVEAFWHERVVRRLPALAEAAGRDACLAVLEHLATRCDREIVVRFALDLAVRADGNADAFVAELTSTDPELLELQASAGMIPDRIAPTPEETKTQAIRIGRTGTLPPPPLSLMFACHTAGKSSVAAALLDAWKAAGEPWPEDFDWSGVEGIPERGAREERKRVAEILAQTRGEYRPSGREIRVALRGLRERGDCPGQMGRNHPGEQSRCNTCGRYDPGLGPGDRCRAAVQGALFNEP